MKKDAIAPVANANTLLYQFDFCEKTIIAIPSNVTKSPEMIVHTSNVIGG